ncbi:DUF1772 domain-containing protein [Nonomuraea sp. NBC_01738]|uniref:anthrone oxygenase family protein n=1 Tax=Nonomuraea sp. NBC_01738 TaxID=2976003 RepID=UPI002E134038|nr:DUF1772 domain-containing protein [Nonomuraea sp. NBC_01738]
MLQTVVAIASLVLTGALAGLFYAFSMSVMPGLGAIDADQAANAMRSINRKILNPWLFLVFIGSPLVSLVAGFLADGSAALWFFLAAAVNFLGSFVLTVAVNVPMNNALEAGTMAWRDYLVRWTRFNTLRAIASLAALALGAVGVAGL